MDKTKWEDVTIDKTKSGVAIRLGTLYYYPLDEKPGNRGHGNMTAEGVNVPFEDEIELLEGVSRVLRPSTDGSNTTDSHRGEPLWPAPSVASGTASDQTQVLTATQSNSITRSCWSWRIANMPDTAKPMLAR